MTTEASQDSTEQAPEAPEAPTPPKRKRKRRKSSTDDFKANHRYHLDTETAVETNHQLLGHIEATFSSGDVTPRSESEEIALQQLVDAGRATIKES